MNKNFSPVLMCACILMHLELCEHPLLFRVQDPAFLLLFLTTFYFVSQTIASPISANHLP